MHQSIIKRSLAFFLSLVLLFEVALPTFANDNELLNANESEKSIIENTIEGEETDCCDHEHEHDSNEVSNNQNDSLIEDEENNEENNETTNLETSINEESEESLNSDDTNFENIEENNENTEEEMKDDETASNTVVENNNDEDKVLERIVDEQVPAAALSLLSSPLALTAPTMNMMALAGAAVKDTSWAKEHKNGNHKFIPVLNDCTAEIKCSGKHKNCSEIYQYFTSHDFPEREGCEEQTVGCTRCNQTYTYPEHEYSNHNGAERENNESHVIYCEKCNKAKLENHTYNLKRDCECRDCKYHVYKCDYCDQEIVEEHIREKKEKGFWFMKEEYYVCKVCGAEYLDQEHKYVVDPEGKITYDNHTKKCTGCGATITEAHKFSGDNGICACGCSQITKKINKGTAVHRYIVDRDDCTKTVYCLATLNTGNDYCSEPNLTFNNDEHTLEYSNITSDTHDAKCKYCNFHVTEPHIYDTKTNKCVCGKDKPICTHEYKFEKLNDTSHIGTCKNCGKTYTENHNFTGDYITTLAPTCVDNGVEERKCTVCDAVQTKVISAKGHNYAPEFTVDKEATCTEAGSKSRHCKTKGCTAKTDVQSIGKKDHEYGEWVTTKEAKCLENGIEERHCENKNCTCTETREIAKLEHNYATEFKTDKEPTCTEAGSKSRHCSRCSSTTDVTEIPAIGHKYGDLIVDTPATCENGGIGHRICSICGYSLNVSIDAIGHNYGEFVEDKEATCTEAGSKSRYCKNEGCNSTKDATEIPALKHALTEWKEIEPTTCISTGKRERSCTRCNYKEEEILPIVPHAFETEFTIDKPVTCTEDGSKSRHCTNVNCIAKKDVTVITATGHAYGDLITDTLATCENGGIGHRICSICEDEIKEAIRSLGHDFDETFTIDQKATLTENGIKSKHCSRCSEVDDETAINKLEITFNAKEVTYDGNPHKIEIEGTLPQGLSVSYVISKDGNSVTEAVDAGSYDFTANIIGNDEYADATLNATLIIKKADMSKEFASIFTDTKYTYDGTEKEIVVSSLPEGYAVEYTNNTLTNVGNVEAIAKLTRDNYNDMELKAKLIIEPKELEVDITKIGKIEKSYDGTNVVIFENNLENLELDLDGVNDEKVKATFNGEYDNIYSDGKATIIVSIEDNNYVLKENVFVVDGKINPIRLEDGSFDAISLSKGLTDLTTIKNLISDKVKDNHKEFEDRKISDLEVEEEISIETSKGYGNLTPAQVVMNGYVKEGEEKHLVITKNINGNVIYNKKSSGGKKKRDDKVEEIKDEETPEGLIKDFEFIDLPKNEKTTSDWAKDSVYNLADKGIIKGYEDNTYRPLNFIRRDEFSRLAYMTLDIKENPNGTVKNYVDTINNWAKEEIRIATTNDVLSGYSDTEFGPEDSITNEQIMAILMRGLRYLGIKNEKLSDGEIEQEFTKVSDSLSVSEWAKEDAAASIRYGLFVGDENKAIKPTQNTTRAQIAVILEKYLELIKNLKK